MLEKNLKTEWEVGTDLDSEIASGASPWSFSAHTGIEICFLAFKARLYIGEWERPDDSSHQKSGPGSKRE